MLVRWLHHDYLCQRKSNLQKFSKISALVISFIESLQRGLLRIYIYHSSSRLHLASTWGATGSSRFISPKAAFFSELAPSCAELSCVEFVAELSCVEFVQASPPLRAGEEDEDSWVKFAPGSLHGLSHCTRPVAAWWKYSTPAKVPETQTQTQTQV